MVRKAAVSFSSRDLNQRPFFLPGSRPPPQLFHAILSDFSRQRLKTKQRNSITAACGVGTVRYHKADGSFRRKNCYTAEGLPAPIDRWPERILCRRSFYVEAPPYGRAFWVIL
jgi:hypothetical protein